MQENVLLDSEGHIKVTDFGLAKQRMNDEARTNSFIGTMEVIIRGPCSSWHCRYLPGERMRWYEQMPVNMAC